MPRDPFEKIADAAQVHRYTGVAPRVSLHIPWDMVADYGKLATHAADLGVRIGAINSNLFQDDDYMLGSLTHADAGVRRKAIAHHVECIEVMRQTGSTDLKIWLPDGMNYPGQDDLRARQDRLADSLQQIYAALGRRPAAAAGVQVLRALLLRAPTSPTGARRCVHCLALGERATGRARHRATTRRAPTSSSSSMQLLRAGRLGAFDFNSRFYADDDLMVGAADPFQLFRIMNEIVAQDAHLPASRVNFMLDQCHNIEPKIPGQIRSVLNVQEATAKALLVDREALRGGPAVRRRARRERDPDGRLQHRRPAAPGRPARGARPAARPVAAYAASGYQEQIAAERVGGQQAGWGA